MEQIDWSKAPADATHYLPEDADWHACWIKPGHTWIIAHDKRWRADNHGSVNAMRESLLVPRPTTWDGEGLPPVGTVCEASFQGGWRRVEVFANMPNNRDSYDALFTYENNQEKLQWFWLSDEKSFRPLRTPEQIAAEEREKAVAEMQRAVSADPQYGRKVCETLYDAGYRKTEPK